MSEQVQFTEPKLQLAVANHVQWWRCLVIPNLCLFHEMDVAVITRAGCLWEFEIKVSQADWNHDNQKDVVRNGGRATRNLRYVERFYYVVAPGLTPPEWLPEWAGILQAVVLDKYENIYLKTVRRAKARHAEKPTAEHLTAISRAIHHRFWSRVMSMPRSRAYELLALDADAA